MILRTVAEKVLQFLEQTDEEEYNINMAVDHVNQAISEICEEADISLLDSLTTATITAPESGLEPDYWTAVPGRFLLVDTLGCTWDTFASIRQAWIDIDGDQSELPEVDVKQLIAEYGDDEGTPVKFAQAGEYIYVRPIPAAGDSYTIRFAWAGHPQEYGIDEDVAILSQMKYPVLYRACMIASVWLMDESRARIYAELSKQAQDRFFARHSMKNDGPSEMEEYNG